MNDTLKTVIFLIIMLAGAITLAYFSLQNQTDCVYNSTVDSFFIKGNMLYKCVYPNTRASSIRSVADGECLVVRNGESVSCDGPLFEACKSGNKMWQDGNTIYVCRGKNTLPIKFSAEDLGINIINGQAVPVIPCNGNTLTHYTRRLMSPFSKDITCEAGVVVKANPHNIPAQNFNTEIVVHNLAPQHLQI